MVKCKEMKQHIWQYKIEELIIVPEDDLMKEMKAKMETAIWEKIKRELPTEYLVETEPITLEEKFNIY